MKPHYGASSWSLIMKPHYGASLWSLIMKPHYEASLWSLIMEPHYGASSWSLIMEPHYGASATRAHPQFMYTFQRCKSVCCYCCRESLLNIYFTDSVEYLTKALFLLWCRRAISWLCIFSMKKLVFSARQVFRLDFRYALVLMVNILLFVERSPSIKIRKISSIYSFTCNLVINSS